jgi:hypothetical protein
MNKLTTLIVLLLGISFSTSQQQPTTTQESFKIDKPKVIKGFTINDDDYTVHFNLENTDTKKPVLVIAIELHNGSQYISPFAKRAFKGKFYMDFGSYKDVTFNGNIIETPRSVEEIDAHPFVNGSVNWVRVNTTYKQSLKILSQEDFEVFGRVRFTIEPRCTLEEIPFAISFKNGVMKIFSPEC